MLPEFDVAVAGGGPAGATCALHLARAGFSVALIDRRAFPRSKICGEYLNCGAVRELRALGDGFVLDRDALPLRGMELHAHGEAAEFRFEQPAWSLPRVLLDQRLHSAALRAGAHAVIGDVYALDQLEASVIFHVRGEHGERALSARMAVGADGMQSTVARLLGVTRKRRSQRFAIGGHYRASTRPNWIEMYAGEEGYLAINPVDAQTANTMFVLPQQRLRRHRNDLAHELGRFSERVSAGRHRFLEAELQQPLAAVGPLAHGVDAVVRGRVLLAGDAAGFVDPFTGQGVYLALLAARFAAEAIGEALTHEHRAAAPTHAYHRRLRAVMTERERLAWFVRAMLVNAVICRRAARALRRRPQDFQPLIDAVSGGAQVPGHRLLFAAARSLR